MFHLVTHAFFKALLFLGAGSVMHATHGVLDIRRLGGLRHKMPHHLHHLPDRHHGAGRHHSLLSGFFSKDAILVAALPANMPDHLYHRRITALLTAIYSFRALFLTFNGEATRPASLRPCPRKPAHHDDPAVDSGVLLTVFIGLANLPLCADARSSGWSRPLAATQEIANCHWSCSAS